MTLSVTETGATGPGATGTGVTELSVTETGATAAEPRPLTLRWQPLRLGLVNLFYYENEEFPFRDGRLLLRGNNGAGKSKVLALTLPFLLDGDTSAQRIEPDADRAKRMEWNLLLGGDHPHTERVGYSWLEFGRRDEHGGEHFFTVGAGLKATHGRSGTKSWFFVTTQRIRHELSLIDQGRVPLVRDRLAAEIGDRGQVFERKQDYRRAIDDKLFRLGEQRYDALLDLLLQIRAPQLSKKPSERLLSDALTESLPPVSRELVTTVADGMRGLDEDREELQELTEAHKAVKTFLSYYSAYARVLVRRKAKPPRDHQSEHDRLGRLIIDLTSRSTDAAAQLAAVITELNALEVHQASREAESEALRDSEYVELEAQLKATDEAAGVANARTERANEERLRAQSAFDAERSSRDDKAVRFTEASARHDGALSTVISASRALEPADGDAAGGAGGAGGGAGAMSFIDPATTRARIGEARAAFERVRELLAAVSRVDLALSDARQREDSAESRLDEAIAAQNAAEEAVAVAADRQVTDVENYLAGLDELSIDDAEFEAFANWAHSGLGENPAITALTDAATQATAVLSRILAEASTARDVLAEQRTILDDRIASLERGEVIEPPTAHTRSASVDGLPLWRAVSFRDEVSEKDRAGVEAALDASGLLTGLLVEAGSLRDPESGELLLVPLAVPEGDPSLLDVLRVDLPIGSPLAAHEVEAVLASIRVTAQPDDPAPVWVSVSGNYRLGAARGAWSKSTAEFVGESARSDARARELETTIAGRNAVSVLIEIRTAEIGTIDGRLARVWSEQRGLPSSTRLDEARNAVALVSDRASGTEKAYGAAREVVVAAQLDHDRRADELAIDARALGLPADADSLAGRASALDDFERAAENFWHAVELSQGAETALAEAEQRLDERLEALERAAAENRESSMDAEAKRAAAAALLGRVGEDVADFRRRVATVATALKDLKQHIGTARAGIEEARIAEALIDQKLGETRENQSAVAVLRVASVDALRRTVALGILRVALPNLDQNDASDEWTVTQGVQLARAIDQALADVDASDPRFERVQNQVHNEFTTLQQALGRHGHQAASSPRDDGYQVVVVYSGRQVTLPDLDRNLGAEIDARKALLGAHEREVIENHLITEVGAQLSELVGAADQQLQDVNVELNIRPTSTGMKLRVRWKPRPDGPAGLLEARALLQKIADAWDETDRASLGAFLQARIAEVRESDETGNWYDHLGDALDYRRWHHFIVERYQGGAWKPATGPASGGERVLAASIPLFAAASSHYRSAGNKYAPRLIMLDEAFAGVDDNSRASCLGLLAVFDLDVVMTSEREWGCYAEVPGLSIAQLSRSDDAPAVLVQLWSWDGHQRSRVESAKADVDTGGLW